MDQRSMDQRSLKVVREARNYVDLSEKLIHLKPEDFTSREDYAVAASRLNLLTREARRLLVVAVRAYESVGDV